MHDGMAFEGRMTSFTVQLDSNAYLDRPAHPQPSLLTPHTPHTMHTQVLRVVPYSAAQLYSYELFKKNFADEEGKLTVPKRLAAGALAGMTATLVRAKDEFSMIGQSKATSSSA